MADYKHFLLRGVGEAPALFRAKGQARTKPVPPVSDRAAHAEQLSNGLDVAAASFDEISSEQAAAGVPPTKRGVLVAVSSRKGVTLSVGKRRPTSPGLKLYGIERGAGRDGGIDRAVYFISKKSLATMRRQLGDYATWSALVDEDEDEQEEAEGAASNPFKLFESADEIRAATYRDLWSDDLERLPTKRDRTDWEVWVRNDLIDPFVGNMLELSIETNQRLSKFVEISVQNVRATPDQMQSLVRSTGAVVGLRGASQLGTGYFGEEPLARYSGEQALLSRIRPASTQLARVTLLDTGVDHSNPLLSGAIDASRCHSVVRSWGATDSNGHGTKMAGVVQFLDLNDHWNSRGDIPLFTELESVKVTAPDGARGVPARWAVEEAVRLVEKTHAPRIYCLAQTAPNEFSDGRVTATSAALDQLAVNIDGESGRLFCVAAGNVPVSPADPYMVDNYEGRNERFGIESPGQAFNVITVGAITNKVQGGSLVAPMGDLAPTSRTASSWELPHALKPDVVLEGGNFESQGVFAVPSPPNLILTTAAGGPAASMTLVGETSAATARAAGLLGRARFLYPNYGPEALRGLLVHSAEWTPAMRAELARLKLRYPKARATQVLFDRFGWGTPNEQRLYRSSENSFTMIVEDTIKPYAKTSSVRINEMKYFKLPWPRQALRAAGQADAELKVTLSYFVEPYAQAENLARYDRYASTRLDFDVKQSGESDDAAQAVFNDEVTATPQRNRTDGWDLGQAAFRGSLHQDTWRGPAYQLADRDGISVAPRKGWWSDIAAEHRFERSVKFALIVSLKAPTGINLMAETSIAMQQTVGTVVEGLVTIR